MLLEAAGSLTFATQTGHLFQKSFPQGYPGSAGPPRPWPRPRVWASMDWWEKSVENQRRTAHPVLSFRDFCGGQQWQQLVVQQQQ